MTNTSTQTIENTPPCPYKEMSVNIALDTARQFITLAVGGMGFIAGFSYIFPPLLSTCLFWIIMTVFGVSICCGLLFCMRTTGEIYWEKTYDVIYVPELRILSATQILLFLTGIILLCFFLQTPANEINKTVPVEQLMPVCTSTLILR